MLRLESRSGTSTRLAHHQASCDRRRFSGSSLAADLLQQQFHGTIAHLEEGDVHAGQWRFLHGAFRPVVEADHCDILRDPQAGAAKRLQRAEGRFVVAGQDRGEPRAGR